MAARKPRPDDVRCAGIYGEKYRVEELRGTQCIQPVDPAIGYCGMHKEIPADRRCSGGGRPHYAMNNQTVCGIHGGKAPQNLRAAERRGLEKRALKLVTTYGLKLETSATDALLEEVKWTAGHVAWLRERVQEIESDADLSASSANPLVWGVTKRKSGGEDRGTTEEATPSIWLKLYQTERAHLVKVCAEAIRAGIEERRVKLAESQGEQVAQAIRGILADLQLTPEQLARVPDIVPKHLRALIS